jgi:ferric-dicitrate binding protein FerR (iron transport regulator)
VSNSRLSVGALAATVLALVAMIAAGSGSAWAQAAGSISAINGAVTITRAGRSFVAVYGSPIDVGDTITTSPNGRATITLSDSSQLELTESSTLVLNENMLNAAGARSRTSVTLLGGLVRSVVRFTAGTPPNFEVHTPNAVASARGTTYDTDYQKNVNRRGNVKCKEFSDVTVYQGTVEVTNPTNPTAPPVDVHAGQKTTVPCGLAVLPATAAGTAGAAGAAGALGGLGLAGAAAIGGGVIAGGTIGGVAASGGFGGGGGSSPPPPHHPISPGL